MYAMQTENFPFWGGDYIEYRVQITATSYQFKCRSSIINKTGVNRDAMSNNMYNMSHFDTFAAAATIDTCIVMSIFNKCYDVNVLHV